MRVLVTGGAGFIGSALARRLLSAGHEAVIFDNFSRGRADRLPPGLGAGNYFDADIRDERAVTRAMQGCEAIVHLAYLQGTQTFYAEPRQVLDVALRGMLNVLAACEATGCADLLLVSSSEAYQVAGQVPTPENVPLVVPDVLNPRYSYGGGKIACELLGMAWARTGVLDRLTIARPHNIYGPDMGREHVIPEFCLRMNKLPADRDLDPVPFPIQGTGTETRSFCYIDDCTAQLMALMDRPRSGSLDASVYHVGTMDEHTIAAVAHQVAACYGRQVKIEPGILPQGSPPRRLPDTSRIDALTGSRQPVPFTEGLEATVAWYRNHG